MTMTMTMTILLYLGIATHRAQAYMRYIHIGKRKMQRSFQKARLYQPQRQRLGCVSQYICMGLC